MATAANRGKWAEGEVRKWMQARSDAEAGYWFYRYPDAHAGSLQTAPADFGVLHNGQPFLVEVKEVKVTSAASRRLPEKNFKADKVARMNKFALAGGESWVVVCHIGERLKEWRLVPVSLFIRDRPASWDLLRYPVYPTVDAVLVSLFGLRR